MNGLPPAGDAGAPRANRTDRARVVVLTGPSGAGKSRLAHRLHTAYGWPVVRLDDFYRELGDPDLPLVDLGGQRLPDWDDPRSWDAAAAVEALVRLVDTGSAQLPVYDIGLSRATGTARVDAAPGEPILAEGIFGAEIVPALRDRGLLATAYCVSRGRWRTFAQRLARDLRERRKPPRVLLGRGWELARREPAIIARAAALGASCQPPRTAERAIAGLATRARPRPGAADPRGTAS